jgi:hypothetical protein
MKKVLFLITVLAGIILAVLSCQKDSAISEQQDDNLLKAKMNKIWICHLNGNGNWVMININQNAWPAHQSHGDKLVFPNVGTWEWVFTFNGYDYVHNMYVTAVTDDSFSGNGFYTTNTGITWNIVNGKINQVGYYTFTIDYDNSNYYLDCNGYYNCDDDGWGDGSNQSQSGTWTLSYIGPLP